MSVKNDLEEWPRARGGCNCFFSCCQEGMCMEYLLSKVFLRNRITDDPNSLEMIVDATILYSHSQPVNENK